MRIRTMVIAVGACLVGATLGVLALIRANTPGMQPTSELHAPLKESSPRTFDDYYTTLTADQRRVVDSIHDPLQREYAARAIWFGDRISGDRDELAPFIAVIGAYGLPASDPAVSHSPYPISSTNVMTAARNVAMAWAKFGPFEGARTALIDGAVRCADDPDEMVQLTAATLLEVMAAYPSPTALPAHAEIARQKMRANAWVAEYIDRDLASIAEVVAKSRGPDRK